MPWHEEKQYTVGIVNPNSNKQLTSQLTERLKQTTQATTNVLYQFVTNDAAAEGIESKQQLDESERALINLMDGKSYDAVVIVGFVDPGVELLREKLKLPVIGMGSAALFAAASLGRFGIITVGEEPKILTEEFIRKKGYSDHCVGIRSLDIGVCGAVEGYIEAETVEDKLAELISDGAASVCLGSGSLVHLIPNWQRLSSVPLIDGFMLALGYTLVELRTIVH